MKLDIMGVKTTVKVVREKIINKLANKKEKEGEIVGLWMRNFQAIFLSKNMKKTDIKLKCLIHEMIHAIDDIVLLNLSEDQTERLAGGLYSVLVSNKKFFKKNFLS
jgi:hypothetical protein